MLLLLQDWRFNSLTVETMSYPRQGTGGLDFRTMANQTAARVLEEVGGWAGLSHLVQSVLVSIVIRSLL